MINYTSSKLNFFSVKDTFKIKRKATDRGSRKYVQNHILDKGI